MTPKEELIERYFDAFNRHDIEGVRACFSPSAGDPRCRGQVVRRMRRGQETLWK